MAIAVVAVPFGSRLKNQIRFRPSNETITTIVQKEALSGTLIYLPTGGDDELKFYRNVSDVRKMPGAKHKPSLFQFAKWVADRAIVDEVNHIIVVTAPVYAARLERDVRYCLREASALIVDVSVSRLMGQYTRKSWYDSKSWPRHTSSQPLADFRESVIGRLPMWLYTRMAG